MCGNHAIDPAEHVRGMPPEGRVYATVVYISLQEDGRVRKSPLAGGRVGRRYSPKHEYQLALSAEAVPRAQPFK